jgi:Prohead core protein serine protease
MSKRLLQEYSSFECDKNMIKESRVNNDGKLIVKGILQRADTLNQNGRIYPRPVLERELENYQKLIRENRALGECDHADSPTLELKHASHVIRKAWFEGDVLLGEVEILEALPMGKIVAGLIESGIKVGISSRALGSVKRVGQTNIVQDDLQLICWDFVSEPSTPGAFMMAEGKIYDEDVLKTVFNKSDRIERAANEVLSIARKRI